MSLLVVCVGRWLGGVGLPEEEGRTKGTLQEEVAGFLFCLAGLVLLLSPRHPSFFLSFLILSIVLLRVLC